MANISHFTQTVNGVSTTYDIHDASAIPKTGSNQISGSLIPSTDNSIDIGSSTNNIKALYTKGITIDAKTIDTDANGNMTYDGHIVDTIEEQGDGYIRYSNGIQICWGYVSAGATVTKNYPKSFLGIPYVLISGDTTEPDMTENTQRTSQAITVYRNRLYNGSCYMAIGMWK